jgi:hypothetical protein
MKLSDQAMGAIMMALQKSLAELTDIVPVLQSLDFKLEGESSLVVTNPPTFKINPEVLSEDITGTTGSD